MNVGDTTRVGQYSPQGDLPYGCADMAGNVWEWMHTAWEAYPYQAGDGREKEDETRNRALAGPARSTSVIGNCALRPPPQGQSRQPIRKLTVFGLGCSPISAL